MTKCANPACSSNRQAPLEGKVFQFEVRSISLPCVDTGSLSSQPEVPSTQMAVFWLCGECSHRQTLALQIHAVCVSPLVESGNSGLSGPLQPYSYRREFIGESSEDRLLPNQARSLARGFARPA